MPRMTMPYSVSIPQIFGTATRATLVRVGWGPVVVVGAAHLVTVPTPTLGLVLNGMIDADRPPSVVSHPAGTWRRWPCRHRWCR